MFGDRSRRYLGRLLPIVPSAPIIIGIVRTFFRCQHFCNSISRSRYLVSFSASFFTIFWHTGIATSIIRHSWVVVLCITMSGRLCATFLSVSRYESHRTFIPRSAVMVSFGSCLSHDSETLIFRSRRIFQCRYFATWLCLNMYCVPASILQPETI